MTDRQSGTAKRTQAERRAETRAAVLRSACSLFGRQGYKATSLEHIAQDCNLTIRPIYYHFGSKRGLFEAVNSLMEQRTLEALSCNSSLEAWDSLLMLCKDRAFRRVIFEDAPNVLGRDRWLQVENLSWSRSLVTNPARDTKPLRLAAVMSDRAALAALIEAAIFVVEQAGHSDVEREAMLLVSMLLPVESDRNEVTAGSA